MRWQHKKSYESKQEREWGVRQARLVLIVLMLTAFFGVYIILRPFLHSIILALLLASVFTPIYRWFLQRTGQRRNLSALFSVLLVFLCVIIPASIFITGLVNQGVKVFQNAKAWISNENLENAMHSPALQRILNSEPIQNLQTFLHSRFPEFAITDVPFTEALLKLSEKAMKFTGDQLLPVLGATWSLVFGFLIMLVLMFYAFRDGSKWLQHLLHLSPLRASQEDALLDKIRQVSRAVLLGMFGTAVVQGVLAMIGFRIVGIPAFFWGTMLGAASLVPLVGTALVWVPAVIYLLIVAKVKAAVFLALWCILIVGTADNFLRPMLMGGRLGMSYIVMFLSIFGGIQCFGPIGIIYGPLIFGLCAVCVYIYEIENHDFLVRQEQR